MKLFKSFAFKNAIFYFTIFLSGLGTIGYLLLSNSSERIIATAKNQLRHHVTIVEIQFRDYIYSLENHLDYLANSPVLAKYIDDPTPINYELVTQNYLSLIRSNLDFSQVRYISATDGKELVRVDRNDKQVAIVPNAKLQPKKERTYFTETLKLGSDEVYFSEINLNREFGKISEPRTPTLRISRPIYSSNILKGVIVINTNLTKLFSKLTNSVGKGFVLRMLNQEGYYLMHEQSDRTFTFEFDHAQPQFDNRIIGHDDNGVITLSNEFLATESVHVSKMNYDLTFQVIANRDMLMQDYYQWRKQSLMWIFLIGLLFTITAFYVLNRQAMTLRGLTDSMKQFPREGHIAKLPIAREDEIGDLARGFEEMAMIINDQIQAIELERHNAQQAELNKSEFIENIAHEIRNPLQSIIGLSELLVQNNPNPNQLAILNSIELNTSNLLRLVNTILDYQSVINGNYTAHQLWTPVKSLIEEIVVGAQSTAANKSIVITSKIDTDLENIELHLDSLRISQLLSNLLSNAITHTAIDGKILVGVKLLERFDKNMKVSFTVEDNGSGMSEEELIRIKERYFTNKNNHLKNVNFGLGLAIVNDLLEQMGSELMVTSQKRIGSIFCFELHFSYRAIAKQKEIATPKLPLIGMKVLVIDDDPQILDLYKHFFKETDADFVTSFEEIELSTPNRYNLVVTDYRLKEGTIITYLESLKYITTTNSTIIIASGAELNMEPIVTIFPEALHIKKPFGNSDLQDLIALGIVLKKYGRPHLEVINKDYDYDTVKYSKALKLLITEWQVYIDRFRNCFKENDFQEFDEILHKLNTTLRRLKLQQFEAYLLKSRENFQTIKNNKQQELEQIEGIMYAYMRCFQKAIPKV